MGGKGEVKIVKIILYTEINLFLQKMDASTAEFSCHLCSKTNSITKQIICLKNRNTFDILSGLQKMNHNSIMRTLYACHA